MTEHRLFDLESPPDWLDPEWWRNTENCNHLAHPAGVHNMRIKAAAKQAVDLFVSGRVRSAVDMGAGDGAVLELIAHAAYGYGAEFAAWGYEIIKDSVRYAVDVRGVEVMNRNVIKTPVPQEHWGDLVICTEMLEHLADPHAWARTMAENAHWLVASSPWGETPEKHEHNHAWAWDTTGYAEMLAAAGWEIMDHFTVEWSQLVVARSTVVS